MKAKNSDIESKGEIFIFQAKDKKVRLDVKLEKDTVWLTQAQIAKLFFSDRSVITKHIRNIFSSKELEEKSNVQKMHIAFSDKPVKLYNLDLIISLGYRINSSRATQFRIWATGILKKHLIEGYTLNEKRLKQKAEKLEALEKAIKLIERIKVSKELDCKEATGLLDVIHDYDYALGMLDDYDHKALKIPKTTGVEKYRLSYEEAVNITLKLKEKFGASDLFGIEKDESFQGAIGAIYQTFDGEELYSSVEEKAANLLYFIVKNHSFIDGNKRIAASIFLWFLGRNGLLYKNDGSKRINDNTLVALTLMIAESNPTERNLITTLVLNLMTGG